MFTRERMHSCMLFYNLDVAKPCTRRRVDSSPRAKGEVSYLSTKGQDGGPSNRVCRFESGRERHYTRPCSSVEQERATTNREAEGSSPSGGTNSWRRNSEERVPACRAETRGFKSRRCRQYNGA